LRITDSGAVEKILKAIADPENDRIMMRVRKESKSAQTLSAETGIPQSTVYRKLDELKEAGLVMTDRFTMVGGKKVDYMIITFSELRVAVEEGQVRVEIIPSDETTNMRWLGLFRGG
jgi:DNA-binding transcriptional ArsR family regulator